MLKKACGLENANACRDLIKTSNNQEEKKYYEQKSCDLGLKEHCGKHQVEEAYQNAKNSEKLKWELTPPNKSSSGCNLKLNYSKQLTVNEFMQQFYVLSKAIKSNSLEELSKFIKYPIVNAPSKITISNINDLKKYEQKIFAYPFIGDAVKPKFFCNYQGIMINDGDIWFIIEDKKLKIKTLNYLFK